VHPAGFQISDAHEKIAWPHDNQHVAYTDLVDAGLEKGLLALLGLAINLGHAGFYPLQRVWLNAPVGLGWDRVCGQPEQWLTSIGCAVQRVRASINRAIWLGQDWPGKRSNDCGGHPPAPS
jgi:hypothetical protein